MGATAKASPNIALVKYWGKRDTERNLPATGSISVTLDDLYTEMTVDFDASMAADRLTVNDVESPQLLPRVSRCLDAMLGADRRPASVSSVSNFPIAAGLASSASAFGALVVAADAAAGSKATRGELARQAGGASGSAARSLFGGYVELCNDDNDIAVRSILDADTWPLKIIAAVTATGEKPVSSGAAMEISRRTSPFYQRWVDEQDRDLATARDAIAVRDFGKLASVAEHNCLKMHSVMWTSRPPVVYWNAATVACMETVRAMQRDGTDVFFTIDAGPQVKAICLPEEEPVVVDALSAIPGVEAVLVSGIGPGAAVVSGT